MICAKEHLARLAMYGNAPDVVRRQSAVGRGEIIYQLFTRCIEEPYTTRGTYPLPVAAVYGNSGYLIIPAKENRSS